MTCPDGSTEPDRPRLTERINTLADRIGNAALAIAKDGFDGESSRVRRRDESNGRRTPCTGQALIVAPRALVRLWRALR
jgi:hypothetical protein